jgi:hypothetical protein
MKNRMNRCIGLNTRSARGLEFSHAMILSKVFQRLLNSLSKTGTDEIRIDLGGYLFTLVCSAAEVRTDPHIGNVSHSERAFGSSIRAFQDNLFLETWMNWDLTKSAPLGGSLSFKMVRGSLLIGVLFRLLGSDVDLFLIFGRLPEVSNPFSKPFTDLRKFSSAKNHQDDDQDNNQLRHSYSTKHLFLLFVHFALCSMRQATYVGGSAWESNPPRTFLPATGFEVQETHQDLSTSRFQTKGFSL